MLQLIDPNRADTVIRDHLFILAMFRHGLPVSEATGLRRDEVRSRSRATLGPNLRTVCRSSIRSPVTNAGRSSAISVAERIRYSGSSCRSAASLWRGSR